MIKFGLKCRHVDHPEHSGNVFTIEQGIADLRGKNPHQRAREIINNCAHPDSRDLLKQ
jgi:succinyl-CoA:acetate CoA-transferase